MSDDAGDGALVTIVEDDAAIAEGLALNFRLQGYRSEIVGDGESAVRQIEVNRPDLVLLDISLPVQSGLWVLEQLRGRENQVPIIVLSARQDEFDKVAALRLGADDYITKPFALAELLARVAAVLRRTRRTTPTRAADDPQTASVPSTVLRFGEVTVDLRQADRHALRRTRPAHAPRVRAAELPLSQQQPRPLSRGAAAPGVGPPSGPGADRRQLRRAAPREARTGSGPPTPSAHRAGQRLPFLTGLTRASERRIRPASARGDAHAVAVKADVRDGTRPGVEESKVGAAARQVAHPDGAQALDRGPVGPHL